MCPQVFPVEVTKLKEISHSIYTTVHVGELRRTKCAVKVTTASSVQHLLREIFFLSLIRSEHVIQVYGYTWPEEFKSTWTTDIITELMDGTLETVPQELTSTEASIFDIGDQLFRGIHCIHGYSIIHRDLKPANVFYKLYSTKFIVKIGDLGIAKAAIGDELTRNVGTPAFMAPEVENPGYFEMETYSYGVDIWSASLIIYELASGKQANFVKEKKFLDYIKNGGIVQGPC